MWALGRGTELIGITSISWEGMYRNATRFPVYTCIYYPFFRASANKLSVFLLVAGSPNGTRIV